MSNLNIGQLITTEQHRDAIHMAVAPMTAGNILYPGEHVLVRGDTAFAVGMSGMDPSGIVDPFLKKPVMFGERFWLLLYPGSITALRHEWNHPAFDGQPKSSAAPAFTSIGAAVVAPASLIRLQESERRLRDIALDVRMDFAELMAAADEYISKQNRGEFGGYLTVPCSTQSIPDDFWEHYQVVRGVVLPEDRKGDFFSCGG